MLYGNRNQPLPDLDQEERIDHRCWSLCCPERVTSVHVFRDRLNGGWDSGDCGRLWSEGTPVPNYSDSPLYARSASKIIYGQPEKLRGIRSLRLFREIGD